MARKRRNTWWEFQNGNYRLYVQKRGREFHGFEQKKVDGVWRETCPGCTITTDTLGEMLEEGTVPYGRKNLIAVSM